MVHLLLAMLVHCFDDHRFVTFLFLFVKPGPVPFGQLLVQLRNPRPLPSRGCEVVVYWGEVC